MKQKTFTITAMLLNLLLLFTLATGFTSAQTSETIICTTLNSNACTYVSSKISSKQQDQKEIQSQLDKLIMEWMDAYWTEYNVDRSPVDHSAHQGFGGTLCCPDGTEIDFPTYEEQDFPSMYTDFASRFSEQDIMFNTDFGGKILLSEDFIGYRYVCFSMEVLKEVADMPYLDIEEHIVYVDVDVAGKFIEAPQHGTIYVLV